MTSKCSSSAAGGGIDKMASVKRIAVIAAVVLLLSMAVVGAASAYTVAYNGNGADSGNVPAGLSGNMLNVSENYNNLTKDDCYFAGWNTQANGEGNTYYPGDLVNISSLYLYAKWVENDDTHKYAVTLPTSSNMTFSASWDGTGTCGGSGNTINDGKLVNVPEGAIVTITAVDNGLDATHYAVKSDSWSGSGSVTQETKSHNTYTFRMCAGNVTVSVNSETIAPYKVTYNKNNTNESGLVPVDSNYYSAGDTVTITENVGSMYWSGHLLKNWNTKLDGTGFTYDRGKTFTMPEGDVTLYAQWIDGYTEVEYLGCSSGGYAIDTGYVAQGKKTKYVTRFKVTSGSTGVFGAGGRTVVGGEGGDRNWTGIPYTAGSGSNRLAIGSNCDQNNFTFNINEFHDYELTVDDIYKKWEITQDRTSAAGSYDGDISLNTVYLFSWNQDGKVWAGMTGCLCQFQIYENGVIVRDLIPCISNNGTLGMYDIVSGTFFTEKNNRTFYAGYKVTYNGGSGGSTTTATQYGKSGDYVTVSAYSGDVPQGKKFSHWNTTSNGSGTSYYTGQTLILTGDITLYAQWVDAVTTAYSVSYNVNNADSGTAPATQVFAGTQLVISGNTGNLVRDGYNTLTEWNTKSDGTGDKYAFGSTYNGNNGSLVLYAKWVPVSYTVRYNANSGTGIMDNQQFNYGEAQTLKANEFTNTGFTFAGWATSAEGEVVYSNEQSVNNLTSTAGETVDLYAKWTENNKYTVTYKANGATGGTVPEDSTQHASGETVTVLGNSGNLVKTGCQFQGWVRSGDSTVYVQNDTFSMPVGNVTLYAYWGSSTTEVTLYKNATDATAPSPDTVTETFGSAVAGVSLTTESVRTGYTLDGWYTASSGGSKILNADGSVVSAAVAGWVDANGKWVKTDATATLYAKWTVNDPTFTFEIPATVNLSKNLNGMVTYPVSIHISNPGNKQNFTVVLNTESSGVTESGYDKFTVENSGYNAFYLIEKKADVDSDYIAVQGKNSSATVGTNELLTLTNVTGAASQSGTIRFKTIELPQVTGTYSGQINFKVNFS